MSQPDSGEFRPTLTSETVICCIRVQPLTISEKSEGLLTFSIFDFFEFEPDICTILVGGREFDISVGRNHPNPQRVGRNKKLRVRAMFGSFVFRMRPPVF